MTTSSRTRRALAWLGVVLAAATTGLLAIHLNGRMGRELGDLPGPERRALYQRTMETLRTTCMHASGAQLTEHCREQANFVERFPECDRECRELAQRFHPQPTR